MSTIDQQIESIMQTILVIEDTDLWVQEQQIEILLNLYRLRTYIITKEKHNGWTTKRAL